jgi:hypothetical protein
VFLTKLLTRVAESTLRRTSLIEKKREQWMMDPGNSREIHYTTASTDAFTEASSSKAQRPSPAKYNRKGAITLQCFANCVQPAFVSFSPHLLRSLPFSFLKVSSNTNTLTIK